MGNKIIGSIKSEPAKWLPIGISSFALLISFLGWREAHRGRLINEAANRPVVTVETNSEAIASLLKEGSTEIVKTLFVTSEIKNLGKTTAVITRIDHRITNLGECKLGGDEFGMDNELSFKGLVGKEIAPNLSLEAIQNFHIPPECEKKRISLVSAGTIQYTDTVSGIPYVQDFFKYVSVPDPTPRPSPSASP